MATKRRSRRGSRKKTSSKKTVILVIVAAVIVAAGVTAFLMRKWQRHGTAFYVAKAVEACRAGEMLRAIGAYGGAYNETLDPRWIVEQGRVAKAFGDASRALASFDKAISARASYQPAHRERVELRLELVRLTPDAEGYANLRRDAEALLSRDPEDARAHLARGVALSGLVAEDPNNARESLTAMRRANELAPGDVEIADALAQRLEAVSETPDSTRRRSEPSPAEEVYIGLLRSAPDSAEARLRYAEYKMRSLRDDIRQAAARGLRLSDREKKASLESVRELLDGAAQLGAEGADAALTEATYWSLLDEPEKGAAVLDKAIGEAPDDLRLYVALSQRLLDMHHYDKARDVLQRGLDRPFDRESYRGLLDRPRRHTMWCMLGESYLASAEDDPARADELIAKADDARKQADMELSPDQWRGRLLLGRILWERGCEIPAIGRYYEADRTLDWHTSPEDKLRVELLLLSALVEHDLFGPAGDLHEEMVKHRPGEPRAMALRAKGELELGLSHSAAGNAGQAVRLLMPQQGPGSPTTLPELKRRDINLREIVRTWWIAARLEREATYVAQAEAMLKPITSADCLAFGRIVERLARESNERKLLDEAAKAYRQALALDPTEADAAYRLATLYIVPERRAETRETIDETLEQLDDRAQDLDPKRLAEARARLRVLKAETDPSLSDAQRDKLATAALSKLPPSPKAARLAAEYHLRTNRPESAVKILQQAFKNDPRHIELLKRLFEAALHARDWDLAKKVVDDHIVPLNVDGAAGRVFEGRIGLARALAAAADADRQADKNPTKAKELLNVATQQLELAKESLRAGAEEVRWYDRPRAWLGRALEELGEDEAADVYRTALGVNPRNAQAHAGLSRVLERQGSGGEEALQHLAAAIAMADRAPDGLPHDPWLRERARERYELEHPVQSIVRREALRQQRPDDANNLLRLGMLYRSQGKADKAGEVFRAAMAAAPRDIEIHSKIAEAVRTDRGFQPAAEILAQLAERLEGRKRSGALLLLGRFIQEELAARQAGGAPASSLQPLRDRADKIFEQAAEAHLTADVCQAAADFCMMTDRKKEAIDWLKRALRSQENQIDEKAILERILRTTLAIRPLPEDAERLVLDYDKRFQGFVEVSLFWGLLHAARGDLDKALTEHSRYISRLVSSRESTYRKPGQLPEAYLLRGKLYMRMATAKPDQRPQLLRLAIDDLQRAKAYAVQTESNPTYVIDLARAYERAGNPSAAVQELKAYLRQKPDQTDIAAELIEMLGRQKKWPEQEALIRQQKSRQPTYWRWAYLLGKAAERRGSSSEAEEAYRQAARQCNYGKGGLGVDAVVGWLRTVAQRDAAQELITMIEKHIRPEDRDYRIWAYYAAAKARVGESPDTEAWIAAARHCFGSQEQGAISRAMIMALKPDKALALATKLAQARPDDVHVQFLRAVMLSQLRKAKQAIEVLQQTAPKVKETDKLVSLLSYLGTLHALSGDPEKAKAVFEEALEHDQDDPTVLNNIAYVLSEQMDKPEQALPYARRAVELNPDAPEALDTLGWCLALAGEPQAGLAVLKEAHTRGTMNSIYYHQAEVHKKLGETDEARRLVKEGLEAARAARNDVYLSKLEKLAEELEQ